MIQNMIDQNHHVVSPSTLIRLTIRMYKFCVSLQTLFWGCVCQLTDQPLKSNILPDLNYYHDATYIAESTGKGSGIFVSKSVTTGTVLMIEKCLMSFPFKKILDEKDYAQISAAMMSLRQRSLEMNQFVDSLSVSSFLAPSSSHESEIFDVQRFKSNAFRIDDIEYLFEYQSKFNHGFGETTANVVNEYFINPELLPLFATSVVVANRDIQAGEELLLAYISPTTSWNVMQTHLSNLDIPHNTETMPIDRTLHDYATSRVFTLNRLTWNEFAAQITDFLGDDAVQQYFDIRNQKIQISQLINSVNTPLSALKLIFDEPIATEISKWQNILHEIASVTTARDKKWLNEGALWCKIAYLVYSRKLKSPTIALKSLQVNKTLSAMVNDVNDVSITLIGGDFHDLDQAQKVFAMKSVHDHQDAERLRNEGAKFFDEKEFLLSIDKFTESIEKSPFFPRTYLSRASAKFYLGTLSSVRSAIKDCMYAIMLLENLQFEDKTILRQGQTTDHDCDRQDLTLLNYQIAKYNFQFAIEYDAQMLQQARDTLAFLRAKEKALLHEKKDSEHNTYSTTQF